MSKNIAVLMGLINMENQRRIMDGMIDAIKETGDNVYIFTNHTSREQNKDATQGVFHIMDLPEFQYFDGIILAMDTITYLPMASYIMDKVRNSQVPFITLNHEVEGYGCLLTSTYDAQYKVIEHLITEHGCREILYIRGLKGNAEAEKRYQAYLDVLRDYQIPIKEEYILDGTFTFENGQRAAMLMQEKGWKPDAVACASDSMACGFLEYCKRTGIRIPEDVRLVGFDNSEMALYSSPEITTIDKNPYELGYRSIYELLAILNGKNPERITIPVEPLCRDSCGCVPKNSFDVEKLKYKYIQKDFYNFRLSELLDRNMADFSGVQSPEEVIPILKNVVHLFGLKNFYLCLCERDKVYVLPETNMGGDFDLMQVNMDYTERIELPLAYENGNITSYKAFPKGMVLPEEVRNRGTGGNYYVVTPICFQNCCYGYVVSGNDKAVLKNRLYYSCLTNIGIAYENIRKRMLLQDAVIRLNNIWSYDMLTQLYNRAGFYYEARTILELLKMQNSRIFVLFSDADGLKKVNDTLGHDAGDTLIKEMAMCFQENLSSDMLAMRYGGDEFVVFGSYEDEMEITYLLESIKASMERRNASGNYPFQFSASIGVTTYNAADVDELSDVIELADAKMYEQKRKKREKKNKI